MVKIYAASQTPRIYGSGAGTLDTTPFLLFDETLPVIASPTTLGYGEHVELTSPVTVGLPNPRKGAKLVIRNMSGGYSSVAAGAILYKGNTYTSLDFNTNTVALLKVIDGVWTASFVTEVFFPIVATGGTVTEFTDPGTGITYRVHSFTSVGSSTFTVSSLGTTSGEVEYLVVAGGGGGGGRTGGGGGAGEFKESIYLVRAEAYSFTVGDGGDGGVGPVNSTTPGAKGGSSYIFGNTFNGGGGGAEGYYYDRDGGVGGSGGGAGRNGGLGGASQITGGGLGNPGGSSNRDYNGAGGGGAGSAGQHRNAAVSGNGGSGILSSINGIPSYYAGGGGGGVYNNAGLSGDSVGIGGSGVGGSGGRNANGQAGMTNTGSGGGGGGGDGRHGGDGGSGIIRVRYAIAYP